MQDKSSIAGERPLRSRATTDGLDRAPHRAFLRAMGLNDEAIAQPFIGVVSTAGEITPCNLTLAAQAAAAKAGVAKAGGTPPGIHYHIRLRWPVDESPGHEIFFGVAGTHCRQHRNRGARALL